MPRQTYNNTPPNDLNEIHQCRMDCISMASEHWPEAESITVRHRSRFGERWCTLYAEFGLGARNPRTHRYNRHNVVFVGPSFGADRKNALAAVEGVWYGIMKARAAVSMGVAATIEEGLRVSWGQVGGMEWLVEARNEIKQQIAARHEYS